MTAINRRDFLAGSAGASTAALVGDIGGNELATKTLAPDLKQAYNDYWGEGHNDRTVPEDAQSLCTQLHSAIRSSSANVTRFDDKPVELLAERVDKDLSNVLINLDNIAFSGKPDGIRDELAWDKRLPQLLKPEARQAYEKIAAPLAVAINDFTRGVIDWVKKFGNSSIPA